MAIEADPKCGAVLPTQQSLAVLGIVNDPTGRLVSDARSTYNSPFPDAPSPFPSLSLPPSPSLSIPSANRTASPVGTLATCHEGHALQVRSQGQRSIPLPLCPIPSGTLFPPLGRRKPFARKSTPDAVPANGGPAAMRVLPAAEKTRLHAVNSLLGRIATKTRSSSLEAPGRSDADH